MTPDLTPDAHDYCSRFNSGAQRCLTLFCAHKGAVPPVSAALIHREHDAFHIFAVEMIIVLQQVYLSGGIAFPRGAKGSGTFAPRLTLRERAMRRRSLL